MLKSAAVLAIPGVLGGIGFLYDPLSFPPPRNPFEAGYVVEVGVAFQPDAVQAALPDGLVPAPEHTGGIALYGGQKGWALSPLTTGYVWIDLSPGERGDPTRYLLHGFEAEEPEQTMYLLDTAASGVEAPTEDSRLLRAAAWPSGATLFDVVIQPDWDRCSDGLVESEGGLLMERPDGSLGVIHMPLVLDLCDAQPVSAAIKAPAQHVLEAFAPLRVLWAGVATPLRWSMPDLSRP